MKKIIPLLLVILLLSSCLSKNQIDESLLVKNFELNKYLGEWYEIARYDNRFEKNLIKVKAEYILQDNGKIKVVNTGYNTIEKVKKNITGTAYSENPKIGQLRVSFFRPFYSYYNIILIDENYTYAVVLGSSNDYLWILGRETKMNQKTYSYILEKISSMGFDTEKLIEVEQD